MPALKLLIAASFLLGAGAFAPSTPWTRRGQGVNKLRMFSDISATEQWVLAAESAYQDAEDASKEFGVSSKEARLAWEAVEEVEQFGSELAAAVPKPLDEECDVELDEDKCRDFEFKMGKLRELAAENQSINYETTFQVEDLEALRVSRQSGKSTAVDTPAYLEAKAEAEAAAKAHGADSPQAKVAWEAVFEISKADDDKVSMDSLDDVCEYKNDTPMCIEYKQAMKKLQATIEMGAIRKFREIDTDNSGTLSVSEVLAGASILGLGAAEAQAWFDELDSDKSGDIDMEEFLAVYHAGSLSPQDEVMISRASK